MLYYVILCYIGARERRVARSLLEKDQRFVRKSTAMATLCPCTPVPQYPYTPICCFCWFKHKALNHMYVIYPYWYDLSDWFIPIDLVYPDLFIHSDLITPYVVIRLRHLAHNLLKTTSVLLGIQRR
jgi:hypothetical protein